MDVGNIKYIKIYKIGQQQGYSQLKTTVKEFCHSSGIISAQKS